MRTFGALALTLENEEAGVPQLLGTARGAAASVGGMADQTNNAVAENRGGFRDFSEGTLPAIDDSCSISSALRRPAIVWRVNWNATRRASFSGAASERASDDKTREKA